MIDICRSKARLPTIYMDTPTVAITPWKTIKWETGTAEDPVFLSEGTDISGDWIYEFKPDEAALHELRKRINQYERDQGTSTWEYYKKIVNPYELIYTQKKYEDFPESVCIYHPLSRSYFKIIEILSVSNFFTDMKTVRTLRSAHVCEGPGGFIEGFMDECNKHHKTISSSTAITLRPKQANVPGWKRASTFLQKHKNVHVMYGSDNTGDLLVYQNQDDFIGACEHAKVQFMTGDGGFDFSTDYDSQEKTIFSLLIASTRVGFEVLADGGLFVLKFFDIYYSGTRDLLCFLSKNFSRWTLYKPATSRPCNPELYFIGARFKRPPSFVMDKLRGWSKSVCDGVVPQRLFSSVPEYFSSTLERIIQESVHIQSLYLQKVFELIEGNGEADRKRIIQNLLKRHEVISYMWCKEFNVCVYPRRIHLIEALRSDLRASGQLE